MSLSSQQRPSLTPDFPLSPRANSQVISSVGSPEPHAGWYSRGYLPHWDHPRMIQTINFRLVDSLPASVLEKWQLELASKPGDDIQLQIYHRAENYLSAGHGECWLRQQEVAMMVENALLHFDGQRYRLLAWCVMPNHVHVLIETREGYPLPEILHSWKSFASKAANKTLQRQGEFWEREYYDRYVRNAEHYLNAVNYIEDNPVKARLVRVRTEWPWSSAKFRHAAG